MRYQFSKPLDLSQTRFSRPFDTASLECILNLAEAARPIGYSRAQELGLDVARPAELEWM